MFRRLCRKENGDELEIISALIDKKKGLHDLQSVDVLSIARTRFTNKTKRGFLIGLYKIKQQRNILDFYITH